LFGHPCGLLFHVLGEKVVREKHFRKGLAWHFANGVDGVVQALVCVTSVVAHRIRV
jgi:hypothetical protein